MDRKLKNQIKNLKICIKKMQMERTKKFSKNKQIGNKIWSEVTAVNEYVMHLSEEDFSKIRLHTNLMCGEYVFSYWHKYPPIDPGIFAREIGYKSLTEDLPETFCISEPKIKGIQSPLGINYKNKVINRNNVRYQSCISNLYYMGILNEILKSKEKQLVLEIGGGYGGLAHHIGDILKDKITYIIVDLPETLLFSGAYLMVNNPLKKFYVYDKDTFTPELLKKSIFNYDYFLVPNYILQELEMLPEIKLLINMQSFHEMAESQIHQYVEFASKKLKGYIYSNNIDRHPLNSDLRFTITSILQKYFNLFPQPKIYDEPHLKSDHPWFYRFYLGIPKGKSYSFPENYSIKIRSYVPDKSLSSLGFYPQVWERVNSASTFSCRLEK